MERMVLPLRGAEKGPTVQKRNSVTHPEDAGREFEPDLPKAGVGWTPFLLDPVCPHPP